MNLEVYETTQGLEYGDQSRASESLGQPRVVTLQEAREWVREVDGEGDKRFMAEGRERLRDEFAKGAMAASVKLYGNCESRADWCYQFADAMLKAREAK